MIKIIVFKQTSDGVPYAIAHVLILIGLLFVWVVQRLFEEQVLNG